MRHGDANGNLVANEMWPDLDGATSGIVREYAGLSGNAFFAFPMGIKSFVQLEARRALDYEVVAPLTGAVVSTGSLEQGQQIRLEGAGAFVVRGTFR